MRLLAFGDMHLKPSGRQIDFDRIQLPARTDAIVIAGDVVHRLGADDVEAGRRFLAALDEFGVPVLSIPGNHDPNPAHAKLTAGLENVACLHGDVYSLEDLDLLGWGCRQFDVGPELTGRSFDSLDPRDEPRERRYAADRSAERIENALFEHVTGDLSRGDLASRLEIEEGERPHLWDQLEDFEGTYGTLEALFSTASEPIVAVTHVPPYGTELDRHHSAGNREVDLRELHLGSIALKIALRVHQPAVAVSGHSHNPTYESLSTGKSSTHLLNLGFRGIATIDLSSSKGFRYNRLR
ncbi:MAG: metallophosphoesterase [Halodesulfurarchaeum sp.]